MHYTRKPTQPNPTQPKLNQHKNNNTHTGAGPPAPTLPLRPPAIPTTAIAAAARGRARGRGHRPQLSPLHRSRPRAHPGAPCGGKVDTERQQRLVEQRWWWVGEGGAAGARTALGGEEPPQGKVQRSERGVDDCYFRRISNARLLRHKSNRFLTHIYR
jgi:hypothetical protein